MNWPYVSVVLVINETNTSNNVVEQPNSELNGRAAIGILFL